MAAAVASSPIERLIARRSAESLSQARTAAKRVLAALERAGVEVLVFESLVSGRMHPKSDLDLLVLAHRGVSWAETERIAVRAAGGFPLDLVFAETLSPGRLARLRAGSLDVRDLGNFVAYMRGDTTASSTVRRLRASRRPIRAPSSSR